MAIANRHGRLIELIRSGEFSSPELAEKLEVSGQTIYRDISFLKNLGFSIRSEKHADGWVYRLMAEPAATSTEKESRHR
ncbi:MAG: HTH domain-containing protein [Planctomycetaceae bacterium]